MKRKLFLALLALATSFALVSCGDDKKDDPKPSNNTATWEDTNSAIVIHYTDNTSGITIKMTETYPYDAEENITGWTISQDCGTAVIAQQVYAALQGEEDFDASQYDVAGSVITYTAPVKEYEDLTKSTAITIAKMTCDRYNK